MGSITPGKRRGVRVDWRRLYDILPEPKKFLRNELSFREREILKLRLGLNDGTAHSVVIVAAMFKVSPGRVRSIEEKAKAKLWRAAMLD